MTELKNFNLALGVMNNILVCDLQNRVVFAGDEIQDVLFRKRKHYNENFLDNFSDSPVRESLKRKLDEVRERKRTIIFEFESIGETVYILPGNYGDPDNIIIATREQILLANQIATDLRERVKELECLYNISHELETSRDWANSLIKCAGFIVRGFQYPEITSANFMVDGIVYGCAECDIDKDRVKHLSENIIVNGANRGSITVYYSEPKPFLREEEKLLKEVALMVVRAVEKEETRKNLEEQQRLLVSQNESLTSLTEKLSTSNKKLNALFNAITDTIVVIDRNFNITISNKAPEGESDKCYRKLFGYDEPCDYCPTLRVFEEGIPVSEEKRVGDRYYMLQSYPIIDNEGVTVKAIEICRNVTKEKQMEQQLILSYKLASLGKLTAGVAHEINNPNTFIRGNIKIIDEAMRDILPLLDQAAATNPELKIARLDYAIFKENIPILVDDMVSGANRIKKIVDGLRNFAKKDEGLLTDTVNINNVVKSTLRFIEKEIRKSAQLRVETCEFIPEFKGNLQKMEQVLMNLLLNAAQAIEHDHGLIRVETRYNKDNNEVIIIIEDNGKGIQDKNLTHVFDPFFTTRRNRGGTGLGLSISYGIVKEHNGHINVDSQVGKGTVFTLSFPTVFPGRE